MVKDRDYKRRKKIALYRLQHGLCIWCGRTMLLIDWPPLVQPIPKILATIEHLKDRHDPDRRTAPAEGEARHALACYICNHRRGNRRSQAHNRTKLQADPLWQEKRAARNTARRKRRRERKAQRRMRDNGNTDQDGGTQPCG